MDFNRAEPTCYRANSLFQFRLKKWSFQVQSITRSVPYVHSRLDSILELCRAFWIVLMLAINELINYVCVFSVVSLFCGVSHNVTFSFAILLQRERERERERELVNLPHVPVSECSLPRGTVDGYVVCYVTVVFTDHTHLLPV